jgi:hypothetical protein
MLDLQWVGRALLARRVTPHVAACIVQRFCRVDGVSFADCRGLTDASVVVAAILASPDVDATNNTASAASGHGTASEMSVDGGAESDGDADDAVEQHAAVPVEVLWGGEGGVEPAAYNGGDECGVGSAAGSSRDGVTNRGMNVSDDSDVDGEISRSASSSDDAALDEVIEGTLTSRSNMARIDTGLSDASAPPTTAMLTSTTASTSMTTASTSTAAVTAVRAVCLRECQNVSDLWLTRIGVACPRLHTLDIVGCSRVTCVSSGDAPSSTRECTHTHTHTHAHAHTHTHTHKLTHTTKS